MKKKYWLMKSEPTSYSIDDLARDKREPWNGVRNYQARNYMREMGERWAKSFREAKRSPEHSAPLNVLGDDILFYHSSCAEPAVVGIGKVCSKPYPDPTAFDKKDSHFDPKSKKEKPTWILVDVCFVKKFKTPVTLAEIKADKILSNMVVASRGSRLSIQPVSKEHFELVVKRGGK